MQIIIYISLYFVISFAVNDNLRAAQKKNYPDIHVHMEPATVDFKDLMVNERIYKIFKKLYKK